MRLFRPRFLLAPAGHEPAPGDRIGGLPVGLSLPPWPRCGHCGRSSSFIAQFGHDPDRLDLGAEGRALTLWQCEHAPGMCATWDLWSGANAALVVETLGDARVRRPDDPDVVVYVELLVAAWSAEDDGGPEDRRPSFFATRLGGVPAWIQSADEAPGPPWEFVGQVSDSQRLDGDTETYMTGPNFGDGGIAYLFLDRTTDPPGAAMFWQCG